jgi:hypothetical protein
MGELEPILPILKRALNQLVDRMAARYEKGGVGSQSPPENAPDRNRASHGPIKNESEGGNETPSRIR